MRNKQQQNKSRINEFADVAYEKQHIDVMMNLIFIDHTAFPKILRMAGRFNKRGNISIAVIKIVLLVWFATYPVVVFLSGVRITMLSVKIRFKNFFCPVHKGSDTPRQISSVCDNKRGIERLRTQIGKDFNQRTALNISASVGNRHWIKPSPAGPPHDRPVRC